MAPKTWERLLFGLLLPVVVQAVGMFIIASFDSRAGAAEFAALGIFFMLLFSLPVVLLINFLLALWQAETRKACFLRGMILPGLVLIATVIYQTGLWDKWT